MKVTDPRYLPLQEKIRHLTKMLGDEPRSKLFVPLAIAQLDLDDPAAAEQTCLRGLDRNPEYYQAYTVLGLALSKQHKNDEAREALLKAVEHTTGNIQASRLLSVLYEEKGDLKQAIRQLQEIIPYCSPEEQQKVQEQVARLAEQVKAAELASGVNDVDDALDFLDTISGSDELDDTLAELKGKLHETSDEERDGDAPSATGDEELDAPRQEHIDDLDFSDLNFDDNDTPSEATTATPLNDAPPADMARAEDDLFSEFPDSVPAPESDDEEELPVESATSSDEDDIFASLSDTAEPDENIQDELPDEDTSEAPIPPDEGDNSAFEFDFAAAEEGIEDEKPTVAVEEDAAFAMTEDAEPVPEAPMVKHPEAVETPAAKTSLEDEIINRFSQIPDSDWEMGLDEAADEIGNLLPIHGTLVNVLELPADEEQYIAHSQEMTPVEQVANATDTESQSEPQVVEIDGIEYMPTETLGRLFCDQGYPEKGLLVYQALGMEKYGSVISALQETIEKNQRDIERFDIEKTISVLEHFAAQIDCYEEDPTCSISH
ncbi:tetratricopeptide repeat protein [Chrysiogenes arsenatis]|uniref:tetratricopeptide repeat protein n=1 Tax=Chrysiogenes arsenatis TaxID=309797 RepID=UPI0004055F58|nr:tetratricopeptide repeat protein [Chrysiogenes arsenatis]